MHCLKGKSAKLVPNFRYHPNYTSFRSTSTGQEAEGLIINEKDTTITVLCRNNDNEQTLNLLARYLKRINEEDFNKELLPEIGQIICIKF
jgi:hypothetical protein